MSSNNSLCLSKDQSIGDQLSDDHSIEDQSTEDNYRRDSFSDRFCDDLCSDILQYLSLEDRLRLECVSKQFQRTVFYNNSEYLCLPQKGITNNQQYIQLFKKWPKLSKIIIVPYHSTESKIKQFYRDLIEMIIKYCNNLTHIKFNEEVVIKTEVQRLFFDKFVNQLVLFYNYRENISFSYLDNVENEHGQFVSTYLPIFTSAPNLEKLSVSSFDLDLNQIQFNRLKVFKTPIFPEYLNDFQVFIERNAKTLKHLTIYCILKFNDKNRKTLLRIITKAINLFICKLIG